MLLLAAAAVAAEPMCSGSEVELIDCAGKAAERADAELNRQWPLTLAMARSDDADVRAKGLNATPSADLLTAQRAWLAFRDAECASEWNEAGGGGDAAILQQHCRERLTRDRVRELKDYTDRP